jgi:thiamine kinase-like enzyme
MKDGAPVIVMVRAPGEPFGMDRLTAAQLAALAQTLQRMYTAVPPEDLAGFVKRRSGPHELVEMLRSWLQEVQPTGSPRVDAALEAATAWVDSPEVSALTGPLSERAFSQGDGNLGNFLWDGASCRVVDFEDCGVSDPAYEVADLVEHLSVWLRGLIEPADLVRLLGFTEEQEARFIDFRRLMAVFWLLMLLPGNPGHGRNPRGSVERQAERLLQLLRR